ncbi:PREDICTED: golgin subfamily A member 6A-like [Colobus angolensis palliatus]|uniref:golgin subfamily A member 6A-like n=1 Tax=Colobus angolensis palliatus TaxID=336983 RepID=UPI0005F51776|nr:PREDICTED: golgin subfamily A member 6A-like [Colobus angolensis palliatus]
MGLLKEYQQRKSPGLPAGAKTKKKKTGSSPETTTSGGCHSRGDSRNQELEVALDSSSATISQLYENIESLKQQKEQVEHLLEEEKKANNEIRKAQMEQLETINILTLEKADLKTTLYHTKRAARHFEEESKDLAGRLQYSLQCIQELERALTAVSTQQQEEDRSSSRSEAVLQRQLQQTRKERALLNAHVTQVTESLKQVQLQRDEYAQHIKGERARWQERMRKMSMEAHALKEEKKHHIHRIQELERSLSKLKHQIGKMGLVLREEERLCEQKERLREKQKRLGEQGERLRKQEDRLRKQEDRLQKQEERLQKQEERLQKQEERLQKQEERLLLSQNHKFDKQLAEPQCDLENLNNKNKSALLLEQQVKELQEKLSEEHLEAASQQNQQLETQFSLMALPGQEFLPAAQNPVDEPAPGAPATQELAAAEEQGDFHDSVEPAAGEVREGSPRDNPTAQKILQLLPVMQDTQGHPGLATKPCVPFFYRAAENREINIIII